MQKRTFSISARAPFRLDLTAWALRRRADNAVDRWDGRTYRRLLTFAEGPVEVAAAQAGPPARPRLEVTLAGGEVAAQTDDAVRTVLARMLGLDIDLSAFYRLAERDPLLHTLAARFRGVKPPRFPSLFECLVNAVACQQLTLTVGIRLLNRLAEAHGAHLDGASAFPLPDDLVELEPEVLRPLGFSRAKARSIVALAAEAEAGGLVAEEVAALPEEAALARLLRLRGIGRWSGEYALLRGLGSLQVFPGDDVGARNNLARRLGIEGPLDYDAVRRAVAPWQPYAGLVYFHLLLANLAERGLLESRDADGR